MTGTVSHSGAWCYLRPGMLEGEVSGNVKIIAGKVYGPQNNLDIPLGSWHSPDVPTVLTIRNIRMVIYPNDHPPPHVPAIGRAGALAKFDLNCPNGPVKLVEQSGFRSADIAEVGAAGAAALSVICARWRDIHG